MGKVRRLRQQEADRRSGRTWAAAAADRATRTGPSLTQAPPASLGDAIARAFAADADGSALPAGVTSWAAEGLARCHQRELLILDTSVEATYVPTPADLPFPAA